MLFLALFGNDVEPLHGTGESHIKQIKVVQLVAFLLFIHLFQSLRTHILRVLVQLEQHFFQVRDGLEAQLLGTQPFLSGLAGIQLFVQINDGLGIDDDRKLQALRLMYRHDFHRIAANRHHSELVLLLFPKRQELGDAFLRPRLPFEDLFHKVVQEGVADGVEMEKAQQVGTKVVEASRL